MCELRSCDFGPRAVMHGWAGFALNKSSISKGKNGAITTQSIDLCIYYEIFPEDGSKSSCPNKSQYIGV